MRGRFVVKQSNSSFTAVATDQCLEQTINRSQRGTGGIIGLTRNKEWLASWGLVHHEVADVSKLCREITGVRNDNYELKPHHESSPRAINETENMVADMIDYIHQHVNPFTAGSGCLRNIATQSVASEEKTKRILGIFDTSCELFQHFCKERFDTKSTSIMSTISRVKVPSFEDDNKTKPKLTTKSVLKDTKSANRSIAIATERGYDLRRLFSFELIESNCLFENDGSLTKEKVKSNLTNELLKIIDDKELTLPSSISEFTLIVDVMLNCRKIRCGKIDQFRGFAEAFCNLITAPSSTRFVQIDFVFDSYFEKSPKAGERERRGASESIAIHEINEDLPLPALKEQFWSNNQNKLLLQKFLRSYILANGERIWPGIELIFSTIDDDPCQSSMGLSSESLAILKTNDIEEADVKMMVHISHAGTRGRKKILLLSSDTDVFILALHHYDYFQRHGIQELWITVGSGATKRSVPLHIIASRMSPDVLRILPAMHHLTGSDYTSKVGRGKRQALSVHPESYLTDFACGTSSEEIAASTRNAEKYLIQVWQKGSACETFDELRYWAYCHSSKFSITELPPTSKSIRLHILRAFLATYDQINCLNLVRMKLKPESFGYYEVEGFLKPSRITELTPPASEMTPPCTCNVCARGTCICRANQAPCMIYCQCSAEENCRNPIKKAQEL